MDGRISRQGRGRTRGGRGGRGRGRNPGKRTSKNAKTPDPLQTKLFDNRTPVNQKSGQKGKEVVNRYENGKFEKTKE